MQVQNKADGISQEAKAAPKSHCHGLMKSNILEKISQKFWMAINLMFVSKLEGGWGLEERDRAVQCQ